MSRARSVADLGNQNVLTVSATDGNINVGTGVTIENTGEAQFSGIVTAQSIDTRNLIGDVSVGGVLTYEDVTSVDSIGVVTARNGLVVGGGATVVGLSTFTKVAIGGTAIGSDPNLNRALLHVYSDIQATGSNQDGISVGPLPHGAGAHHLALTYNRANDTGLLSVTTGRLGLTASQGVGLGNNVGIGTTRSPGSERLHVVGDSKFVGIVTSKSLDLDAIYKDITDTAVDIFVYDTSKDSDGGAWRHRTTHTSWYNETLNTATRGTRREFPSVAVIVAETDKVTIYDGDDPDLPMWMEFISTGGQYGAIYDGRTIISLVAKNGEISVADSVDSVVHWNFIADTLKSTADSGSWNSNRNIADRNPSDGINLWTNYNSSRDIVGYPLYDLAITVLPNAPIDPSTGLPVPTIAVATDGGTSIIKDDGSVADLSGFSPVTTVHIDENNVIGTSNSGTPSHDFIYKTHIPSGDEAYSAGIIAGSKNYYMNSNSGTIPLLRDIDMSDSSYDSKDDVVYRGGNAGFDIIMAGVNYSTTHSNPAIAYISKDYNTGYMVGDIKGAFLSDTSTMNAGPDSNIVSNGTFDSNIDGWTLRGGTVDPTHSSGTLQLAGESSFHTVRFTRNYNFIPGNVYYITWTMTGASSQGIVDYSGGTFTPTTGSTYYYPGAGTYTIKYVPTSATPDIAFVFLNTAANTGTLDNVSIIPAEEDRSLNNNPLQVYGTITKSAVATGADLVAYSGYSPSNYFSQPSITAPGTGDFSIISWIKPGTLNAGTGNYVHVFSLGTNALGGQGRSTGFALKLTTHTAGNANGYSPYLYSGDGGTDQGTYGLSNYLPLGQWSQLIAMRRGGVPYIYINGNLVKTGNSWTTNLTDTYLTLFNGIAYNEYGGDAEFALLRYSVSAPSAEQVKKMYEDERYLFQENAKATLYGSSDAVTALGYDDATELLHVGTSSGRSDFRGLRRINNTTTAVTTAISASKEFVAEQ